MREREKKKEQCVHKYQHTDILGERNSKIDKIVSRKMNNRGIPNYGVLTFVAFFPSLFPLCGSFIFHCYHDFSRLSQCLPLSCVTMCRVRDFILPSPPYLPRREGRRAECREAEAHVRGTRGVCSSRAGTTFVSLWSLGWKRYLDPVVIILHYSRHAAVSLTFSCSGSASLACQRKKNGKKIRWSLFDSIFVPASILQIFALFLSALK